MSLTLAGPVHSELVIRKSRFIGCVQPVAGRAEALAIVAALRAQHPGAAHVCWALLAGGSRPCSIQPTSSSKACSPRWCAISAA